jgi:tellurite methyltransferase
MTFHTREQVQALLEPLEAERFEDIEEDGETATGKPKHWHVYYLVARRP